MKIFELENLIINKFNFYIQDMTETVSRNEPAAQNNEQKLSLHVYSADEKKESPIQKISFMILEDGMIKNKDDKEKLELGEFTVITIIPHDSVPLPVFTMECSIHFDNYIQCRVEIPPVAPNPEYHELFCKPVQELRQGLEKLEGLHPHTSLPGLEKFSSGGLLTAHINPKHKDTVLKWLTDYIDLYLSFVDKRDETTVLKDSEVIQVGAQRKAEFCMMFGKMAPRILTDLPDLYSDALARKIGEVLF